MNTNGTQPVRTISQANAFRTFEAAIKAHASRASRAQRVADNNANHEFYGDAYAAWDVAQELITYARKAAAAELAKALADGLTNEYDAKLLTKLASF